MPSTSSSAACIFSRSSACARFGTRLVRTEKASPRSSNCSTSRRSSSRSRETHDLYVNEAQPADPDASSHPEDVAARKAWWTKDRTIFAEEAARQVRQQLAFASDKAAAIQASPRLTALMDFRHAYIAHNLTLPEPDMKTEATVAGVCLRRFVSGPG
jgi:hypothetical protein